LAKLDAHGKANRALVDLRAGIFPTEEPDTDQYRRRLQLAKVNLKKALKSFAAQRGAAVEDY